MLGGMLTTWLSWRWVFLVNVPVGATAALLTPRLVAASAGAAAGRSRDVPGVVAAVAGLGVLVYALSGAADHGWGSARTLGLLALAALLLGAFAAIERAVADPLVPPPVWRERSLAYGAAAMLGATGILAGSFFLDSLYLQRVLGWSALDTGLAFLPFVAAIALGVHATSHLIARAGSRALIVAGMALVTAGALLLALAPDRAVYATDLLPAFVLVGFGIGLVFPAVSITAMSEVDHDRAGLASGVLNTAHEIGAALGVAVLSAVAAGTSGGLAAGYGAALLATAIAAGVIAAAAAAVVPAVRPPAGTPVSVH
jgi:MFS family permease